MQADKLLPPAPGLATLIDYLVGRLLINPLKLHMLITNLATALKSLFFA